MSFLSQTYFRLLNLLLEILVKSESIPKNPITDLNLDISRPIIYVLQQYSKSNLLVLREKCLEHNLPDPISPLIINKKELPRCFFIHIGKKILVHYRYASNKLDEVLQDFFRLHQEDPKLNIQIIPVFIMFGRRPSYKKKKKNSTSIYLLNRMQRFFSVLWFGRDSFVHFSSSISLRWVTKKYNFDKTIVKKLVRVAHMYFIRQYLVATGPQLIERKDLFKKLLNSKVVSRAIKDEVRNKKISYKKAQKNATALIEEIAANFSYELIRLTDRILSFTWNFLYQKINVNNIDRVQKAAHNGHEIVYIPCHRSHMDYLLLSYVLYHQGLAPPHIAAGINLNFWPTGPIFRRLGAFFIRRTFRVNKLYSAIFRKYLEELFKNGCPVEFFLEGARSRTGRLLVPKTGTLSITIQTMLYKSVRPITLIPIYIGYEHVIEVGTYIKELRGAKKEKESFLEMMRGLIKLRNLGQSYVNFGEPLLLKVWLNQHVSNWSASIDATGITRPNWLTSTVNCIATDLMVRINNAVAINATNLCSTALLSSFNGSLTRKQLIEQLNCYLDLMRNVPYSSDSTLPSTSAEELIDHALKMHKFKVKKSILCDIIILPLKQAELLTYYRNNIIHILILPSLIATVVFYCKNVSRKKLFFYINILYPMLKAELFLRWSREELEIRIDNFANELLRQKLLLLEKDELQVNPSRFYTLKLLADGARETLHRYAIIFWLLSVNPSIRRQFLEKKSQDLAKKVSSSLYGVGNALELFDKATFNVIISTLCDKGYLNDRNVKCNEESKEIMKIYRILSKLITLDVRLMIERSRNKTYTSEP